MYNSVVFIDSCDMKSKINFKENILNIYTVYSYNTVFGILIILFLKKNLKL
jgi:hypothetical protein